MGFESGGDRGDGPTTATHEEAQGLLKVAKSIGYACILWGDVGIGKSTLVEQYGKLSLIHI